MKSYEIWSLVITGFSGVATAVVSAMAIWGEQIRAKLTGPKLRLTFDPEGCIAEYPNSTLYYMFRIVNSRPGVRANGCRVLLKSFKRRQSDGTFVPIPLPYYPSLVWSPSEDKREAVSISKDQKVDFGSLREKPRCFVPTFQYPPGNLNATLTENQCARYGLEIEWDSYPGRLHHKS